MTDAGEQMRCEWVEDHLLDLVYGDLGEREAREMRAHADACEGCRRSLARLEGGRALARRMPVSEPGADLLASVRAAARARAQELAAPPAAPTSEPGATAGPDPAATPRPSAAGPERGWWSDLLRWLGSMAMGPQVAMATLLLLMIGIGLWSLPSLRGRTGRDAGPVVDPDLAGELGPSRALAPAEPLAFDFNPRTKRLAPVGEVPPVPPPRSTPTGSRSTATAAESRRAEQALERVAAPREEATGAPGAEADDLELAGEPRGEGSAAGRGGEELVAMAEVAPRAAVGGVEEAAPPERDALAGSAVATAEAVRPVAPVAPAAAGAAPPPAQVAPTSADDAQGDTALAAALHRQAREAATRGANAECIRLYQTLLSRHAGYPETGRALLEMAECERRSGRLAAARRTLERAERIAVVRADATRELARLRSEEEELEAERSRVMLLESP